MKKTNFLKIALTLVMAYALNGAFAQTPIPGEDVINYVSTGVEATTAVTIGKTIPLYALPDAYFHPTYDPALGTGITAGFTWTWSSVSAPANITLTGAADNYVEVTGVTVGGPYTVSVFESSALCADATPQTIAVSVLARPTVAITTPALATYEYCLGDALLPTNVIATIAANGATNYRLVWDLEIYTMNASAVADEWFATDKTTSLGAVQDWAEEFTQAIPDAVAASGAYDITSIGGGYTLAGAGTKTTVYVYTVRAINDIVSRRGDFLAIDGGFGSGDVAAPVATDFMYYDVAGINPLATTDVVTITVHPTPVTGPIYHIGNTWAN